MDRFYKYNIDYKIMYCISIWIYSARAIALHLWLKKNSTRTIQRFTKKNNQYLIRKNNRIIWITDEWKYFYCLI